MRNSLKISTIALVLVTMLAGSSKLYASSQRLGAMGLDGSSYWMLGQDTTTTAYFPSYATRFPMLIAIQPIDAVPNGAMFLKFMDNLAIWLKGGAFTAQFSPANAGMIGDGGTGANVAYNYYVLAAYKMGNMGFGLSLGIGDGQDISETKVTATPTVKEEYTTSEMGLHLGFDMDLGGGMGFDVGLKYVSGSFDGKTSNYGPTYTSEKYEATPSSMAFYGRFNMPLTEVMNLHVFLAYTTTTQDGKSTQVAAATTVNDGKKSNSSTMIGISDELKFGKGAFAFIGLTYSMDSVDTEDVTKVDGVAGDKVTASDSSSALKAFIGTQAQLTKNLSGLIGVNRIWNYSSTEEDKTAYAAGGSSTTTVDTVTGTEPSLSKAAWGLIYTMGHFKIEGNMSTALLADGPYLISGLSNSWATSLNIVYVFGNPGVFEEDKK